MTTVTFVQFNNLFWKRVPKVYKRHGPINVLSGWKDVTVEKRFLFLKREENIRQSIWKPRPFSWLDQAKEMYMRGDRTQKAYNDCLIATKPNWLLLERSDLPDIAWKMIKEFDIDKEIDFKLDPLLEKVVEAEKQCYGPSSSVNQKKKVKRVYRNQLLEAILNKFMLEESMLVDEASVADVEERNRLLYQQNETILKLQEELKIQEELKKKTNQTQSQGPIIHHYEIQQNSTNNRFSIPLCMSVTVPLRTAPTSYSRGPGSAGLGFTSFGRL